MHGAPLECRAIDSTTHASQAMNPTQSLLDSITAGDYQAAGTILDRDPSAAQGVGPAGESPVLAALYRGQTGLARRIGAHR